MRGFVVKRLCVLAVLTATIGAILSSLPTVLADPISLDVVETTDTTVDLEWTKTSLPEAEFGWYSIERHTKDFELFYIRVTDIDATSWTDRDLHPSTEYGYKIYVCNATSIWPACVTFEESDYVSAITQDTTVYATKWELAVARSELLHALWSLQQLQSILRMDAVNETDELWDAVYSLNENITQLRQDIVNITSILRSESAEEFVSLDDDVWSLHQNISVLRSDAGTKTGDLEERIDELDIENSQLRDDAQLYLMLLIVVLIIAIIAVSVGAVGVVTGGRLKKELRELPPLPIAEIPEEEAVPEEKIPEAVEEVPEEMAPEPVEEVEPSPEEREIVEEEKAEVEEGEGAEKEERAE